MGDPLFTPAVVGYFVSVFFDKVLNAAKGAYELKEKCRLLLESVDKLQPHIDGASQHSANWEEAQSEWLKHIKDLLDKARAFATKVMEESKYRKLKRAVSVWHWGKLPSELMDIVRQIEEAKKNVVFVAALEIFALRNASKTQDSRDFLPQEIPSYIVGVDEPFRKLKQSVLASHAKDTANHLGLHGRGGAGKTLIAKMLHNDKDIRERYGAHSIMWITVGHDAKVSDLYKAMATDLNDGRFEKTYAHRSLKDQRTYLWNVLSEKRVFLILDDVWQEHCEDNHEMIYWLNIATAPGSATLLTTRNTSVLTRAHAESEVVLSLSEEDSWKLFSSHAFEGSTRPPTISEELARDVCNECKGLPLALKVIGSAMLDKEKEEEWSCALHDLRQSQPILGSTEDDELFGRLRLSYEKLNDDALKTCFLYIGAFPEDYEIPTRELFDIWISEELFGSLDGKVARNKAEAHLELLEKRSLIQWNHGQEYVQVHDVLRDLALYIINKAKPGECAYECFFQCGNVIKSIPSSERLQAIKRMSFKNVNISKWPKGFEAPDLKVLLLSSFDNKANEGHLQDFRRCATLRYLDLSKNKFLKEIPASIGELKYLTTLDLTWCKSLKELRASIGELKCLMTLHLKGCESLKEVPASIGELKCLTNLDLSWCRSLKELPASIGELKCLKTLDLSRCKSLKEIQTSIGKLKCLTSLHLVGCHSLKKLPASIGELKCLTILNVSSCESLKELPTSICELKYLTSLYLFGCKSLKELPTSIGELKCLTTLSLSSCESLKELPASISELKCLTSLYLPWCHSLKELPASIGELKCLTTLCLPDCHSLKELPTSISELKCLTTLRLPNCHSLKELLTSISELKCLTTLHLSRCTLLKELPASIGELKCLTTLNLCECESLKELPGSISELKCLITLDLSRCESLKELPTSISELKCLKTLSLSRCKSLNELPASIGKLKCLKTLDLSGCESLKELPASIGQLKCLTTLDLFECKSLKELPASIGELKCLTPKKYLN